jgi:hypothetical protein
MKWDLAHSNLSQRRSTDRLFAGGRSDVLEDIEILLEVVADVGPKDSCIQGLFPNLASRVLIEIKVVGNDQALFSVHRNSSK